MSYTKIILHCVWSTKNREAMLIDTQKRYELFDHIMENARKKKIWIDHIGGMSDHVHCLLYLGPENNIATVMREIKAEASYWFNKQSSSRSRLEWQDSYFAVSVSPERLEAVRRYIRNQEIHHASKTFTEEYDEFLKASGIEKNWIKTGVKE